MRSHFTSNKPCTFCFYVSKHLIDIAKTQTNAIMIKEINKNRRKPYKLWRSIRTYTFINIWYIYMIIYHYLSNRESLITKLHIGKCKYVFGDSLPHLGNGFVLSCSEYFSILLYIFHQYQPNLAQVMEIIRHEKQRFVIVNTMGANDVTCIQSLIYACYQKLKCNLKLW